MTGYRSFDVMIKRRLGLVTKNRIVKDLNTVSNVFSRP